MRHLSMMIAAIFSPMLCYCDTTLIPSINDIMSLEDQKTTGVIRLTQEQKKALAEWFVKHGYYEMQAKVNYNHVLTISINIGGGQKIVLSDNSVWEVAPEDQELASGWLGSNPVEISPSENKDFPFLMTNVRNRNAIKVRKSKL